MGENVESIRIALLTNTIAWHRVSTLVQMLERCRGLYIHVSSGAVAEMPSDLVRRIVIQRSIFLVRRRRDPVVGGTAMEKVHLPLFVLFELICSSPRIVIAGELGFRSMMASVYRLIYPSSRLILHVDLSEDTEVGVGWFRRGLRRLILCCADAVIVNGRSGARYVAGLNSPPRSTLVIPYATDTKNFDYVPSCGVRDVVKMVYVGKLIPLKGLKEFVEVAAKVLLDNPEKTLVLRLVGDGPCAEDLEAVHRPSNFELQLVGACTYTGLSRHYGWSDVFVIPTLRDTWALVVNEAMCTGRPVLGSVRSQAVQEMVQEGKSGWTFDPVDREDMRRALVRCISADHQKMCDMGLAARKVAMEVSHERVANDFIKAFHTVLNDRT